MTNLPDFSGQYQRQGKDFVSSNGTTLAVLDRTPTPTKTPNYIVFAGPNSSKRLYWSSMYPTKATNVFRADYAGKKYLIEFDADSLNVKIRS